jgi:hypothetical protein
MPILDLKTALLLVLLICLAVPSLALVPPGRIMVSSIPSGALACMDIRDCDITPATFTADGNIWHTIVVTENGYQNWTSTVYVTSGQISMVDASLNLNPDSTAIRVSLEPGGGTVCLDNSQCQVNVTGSTGSTLFSGVSPGHHTLSVRSPAGYEDTTKLVRVTLGKITDVSIALDPVFIPVTPETLATLTNWDTGNIRVYVDRTGSTICIDTVNCFVNVGGTPGPGTGTTVFNEVPVDVVHTISVAADGYRPVSANVSVAKDEITTVDVKLQPLATETASLPALTPAQLPADSIPPPTTRAGLDVLPLIGALALCGAIFLFHKEKE